MQDPKDIPGAMDSPFGRTDAPGDDEQLFARVASGDRAALRPFYLAYHRRLQRFLLRITRDPQLADEAVNDTLLIVWQQAARFRHESRISTWVMGIAYRRALKALESRRRARAAVESEWDRRQTLVEQDAADDVASSAERDDWLERALATLSDEHRLAIELAYYVGLSCAEIAEVADCPVGTVKTRLHYARRQLHATLEGLQGTTLRHGDLP